MQSVDLVYNAMDVSYDDGMCRGSVFDSLGCTLDPDIVFDHKLVLPLVQSIL